MNINLNVIVSCIALLVSLFSLYICSTNLRTNLNFFKSKKINDASEDLAELERDLRKKFNEGDLHAKVRLTEVSWNRSVKIGTKVDYLKSEIEGFVTLKTTSKAFTIDNPVPDKMPKVFIHLSAIGFVCLDKVSVHPS